MKARLIILLFIFLFGFSYSQTFINIHLAIGNDKQDDRPFLIVGWQTKDNLDSYMQFGYNKGQYVQTLKGFSRNYDIFANWNHFAYMPVVNSSATIYYRVGDNKSWSDEFTTRAPEYGKSSYGKFSFFAMADYGIDRSENNTIALNNLALNDEIEFIIHPGDISYANDHPLTYEKTWEEWFARNQPTMTKLPYMVCPGNHESWCRDPVCAKQTFNFTAYKSKFEMPGNQSGTFTNMFYSWNYKNIHFVSISTESDFPGYPFDPIYHQHYNLTRKEQEVYFQMNWLEEDLAKANLPANRQKRPWIIAYGHRPIYDSGFVNREDDPAGEYKKIQAVFEPLFRKHGVDLYITGHAHNYQRIYPVYNDTILQKDYNNPNTTIYLISGAGGSIEGYTPVHDVPWLAFGLKEWGYTKVDVESDSQLTWSFVQTNINKTVDTVTITKNRSF